MNSDAGGPLPPGATAEPEEQPRTAADRASYWMLRGAELGVRLLPRGAAYAIADVVGQVQPRLAPGTVAALRRNLARVRPDLGARELDALVRRGVAQGSKGWIDVLEMRWRPKALSARLDILDGLDGYFDAQERGHGVVAVSMHWGAWEAGLAAWNRVGQQMALLAERMRPVEFFDRIAGARGALGVKVIPIDAELMRHGTPAHARRLGAQAMREVLKQLRIGGTVAIAIDRDITASGSPMPFFGVEAPIPIGTIDVAVRSGAAIIPVVLERRRRRLHAYCMPEITYDQSLPREQETRRVTAAVLAQFEEFIRRHPEQWNVREDIWPAAFNQ